ncbi:restriction endonuclease subunit S [Pseudomonas defluvii]|nr:restriction endonuclease subunit S [Pseudomonas defluvii]
MKNLSGANLNNSAVVGPQGEGRESPSTFPAYPAYKKSGVDWLGEVPAHWDVAPAGMYYEIRNGFPFAADNFSPEGSPEHRLIRIRDILRNDSPLYTDEPCPVQCVVENGDILIGMDGDFNITSWAEGKAKLNQRVCAIRGSGFSWDRFFFYGIGAPLKIINDLTFATTVKHLASSQVMKTRFPVPPEIEMENISNFLDHETARIDALIEEQQRLIELLKEKRQALISQAVTKGLDPTVPMKDSGVEWLGEVPAHWPLPKLGHLARVLNGSTPSRENMDYWHGGDIPWVASGSLNDYRIDLASEFITKKALKECSVEMIPRGAILVGLVGQGKTRGLAALLNIDATINQNVCAVVPDKEKVLSGFLHLYLHCIYEPLRDFGRGANQAALNCELVSALRIPLPCMEEQSRIVRYIENKLNEFDALEDYAQRSIGLMQERRSALISAAVTGKIDVRGWQPPASTQAPKLEVAEAV